MDERVDFSINGETPIPVDLDGLNAFVERTGEVPLDRYLPYSIPGDGDFGEEAFCDGPTVRRVAEHVQAKYPDVFEHIDLDRVRFLWKAKGGESKGRKTLGKVGKLSPRERHMSDYRFDFWIWIGADNVADSAFDARQFEALVFHELKHLQVVDGALVVVGHDFEGFAQELYYYGSWKSDAQAIVKAAQPSLFEELPAMTDAEFERVDRTVAREGLRRQERLFDGMDESTN